MGVVIRPGRPDDAAAIAAVHVASWRSTYRGIVPDHVLDSLSVGQRTEHWQQTLSAGSARQGIFVFVAEDDREIVGFVSGGPEREGDEEFDGEVYAFYLRDDQQGRGLGRQLFEIAVERLRAGGHRGMLIWALAANPAGGFYQHMGGRACRQQTVQMGRKTLRETGYGWDIAHEDRDGSQPRP